MNITMIRHTSVDVSSGTCYGQTDVPLKATFVDEAKVVKEALDKEQFDMAFTSPLSRCVKLATFCGFEKAQRDSRLMEMNFGEWEGRLFDKIEDEDPRLGQWYDDYINVPATGGESFAEMQVRVKSFLDELKQFDYQNVVIFTHGGVIIQVKLILGLIREDGSIFSHQPPYGGIVKITI